MARSIYKRIKRIIIGSFYPRRCVLCDELLEVNSKAGVCPSCKGKLRFAIEPVCKKCGKPLRSENDELCVDCTVKNHAFVQSKGIYIYEGKIKGSMYRFKYSNRRCYKYVFAKDAIKLWGRWICYNKIEAVIAVPMYAKKKRRRGYNQAEVFGKELAEEIGVPFFSDVVVRNRNTIPMKGLSESQREKNLKNAFNFVGKGIQLKRVLVVDDIYTTGATLDSVAKCLRNAGIESVFGMCICVGKGYLH